MIEGFGLVGVLLIDLLHEHRLLVRLSLLRAQLVALLRFLTVNKLYWSSNWREIRSIRFTRRFLLLQLERHDLRVVRPHSRAAVRGRAVVWEVPVQVLVGLERVVMRMVLDLRLLHPQGLVL